MRFLLVGILICLTHVSWSQNYTFTGSGDYTDPANWAGGSVPPVDIGVGVTVTIQGDCITSPDNIAPDLEENFGTVTVDVGGSLVLNNATQFTNDGALIINGTFTSNTTFEGISTGSVTVSGTFNNEFDFGNEGLITISGGTFNNDALLDNTFGGDVLPGTIIVDCGGSIVNTNIFKIGNTTFNACSNGLTNTGTLSGDATIGGDLNNAGVLAPGNSPGLYTVTGAYSATPTAVHNFEIGGTDIADYDRLVATGAITLDGTLNVSLINGFVPSGAESFTLFKGSSVTGTFSTVNIPPSLTLTYRSDSVFLSIGIPLPVTFTDFNALVENSGVLLSWQTSSESDNSGFDIERSDDGNNWTKLSFVQGHGTTSLTHNYKYLDPEPVQGTNYYRLKQIDINGNGKYSKVVTAVTSVNGRLMFYPNPAKNIAYLRSQQTGLLTVYNTVGQVMISQILVNATQIDVSKLTPGQYFIQLRDKAGNTRLSPLSIAR